MNRTSPDDMKAILEAEDSVQLKKLTDLWLEYELEELGIDDYRTGITIKDCREERIISKKYGFIKRLVENDKIDISKFEYTVGTSKIGEDNRDFWYDTYSDLEKVLMLLSISDTPIDDLIEYLK